MVIWKPRWMLMLTWLRCSSLDILEEYGLHSLVTYMSDWPQMTYTFRSLKQEYGNIHLGLHRNTHWKHKQGLSLHYTLFCLTLWGWTILYYLLPFRYRIMLLLTNCLLSITSHIHCIAAHCLINFVFLTAYAFFRSWWRCTFWLTSPMTLNRHKH